MSSNDCPKDKFALIKEMLSGQREAIYVETRYILKVEILDIVKDHSLIEIGLGVTDSYELSSFFSDLSPDYDQPQVPNFFTLYGVEESIFLSENRIYIHYLNAYLILGEELVKKFLNRTLKPSDL